MAWTCGRCAGENPEGTRFCGHCGAASAAASDPEPDPAATVLRSFVAGPLAARLEQGVLDDERRLVTALFADLSGFTPLAERLDPEQLQEVIDPLIALLSDVVARYGGYVDKYAGDALLALFGAPVAHEDDPVRALRAALAMHEELTRATRDHALDWPLSLHIGVNSGHVVARVLGHHVRMDYAVVGDAVILAQRLESAASGGETYVGESTVRLTRGEFDFEALEPVALKGKQDPVPVWRLLGRKAERRPDGGVNGALFGRALERERIEGLFRRASGGRGGVCLVTGEPGIGKTALTDALRSRATEQGARWFEGRCLSYGAVLPYWPYVTLLRDLLDLPAAQAPEDVGARLARAFPHAPVARLVPYFERLLGIDSRETDEEPEAFQRGLRRSFWSLLEASAQERPTIVAIEDAHWMDASSHALTAELARLCCDERVVLYVTGRPEAAGLLATIGERVPDVRRLLVELGPLGVADVRALIRARTTTPLPAAAEAAVAERTGGNPLFVEEVLRWLEHSGASALVTPDAVDSLPPTVEGLLSARIDRLPPPAASVLLVGSVVGRSIPLDLLRDVVAIPDLPGQVNTLVDAGFLDRSEDAEVAVFHHPLVQEAAYGRLLRRQRRDAHLRVAEAAEALYGAGDDGVPLLARHYYLAESPKALDYLTRAAAVARRLYANDEAIVDLKRAAEVAEREGDDDVLPGIMIDLADLLELRGDLEEAFTVYTRAGGAAGGARSWIGMASTLRKRGRYQEALATLKEADNVLPPDDRGHGTLGLERARTLVMARRFDDAETVLDEALRRVEPGSVEAGYLLLLLSRVELAQGRTERALSLGEEARAILERHGDQRGVVSALRNVGAAHGRLGELGQAAAALRRGIVLGERVGNAEELAACLLNLGMVELRLGAVDEAIACDLRAIEELERMGHQSGLVNGYANLASALVRAGRLDEALVWSERTIDAARRIGDELAIADAGVTQATAFLAAGDAVGAGRRAEEAAERLEQLRAGPPAREALALAAQAWDVAGDGKRADAARKRAAAVV